MVKKWHNLVFRLLDTSWPKWKKLLFYFWGDVLQECGDFTWRVYDCEELEGFLTGDDGGWF